MRYLITHSLLSSWQYCLKENPYEDSTTERDPMAEFLTVLRREQTPTTEAMQKGIDFEDLVTKIMTGETSVPCEILDADANMAVMTEQPITLHPWYEAALKIAQRINGAKLQLVAKKEISVGSMTFLLYGRLDALHAGTIYDIKFSSKYDRGKFFDSTQHPTYMELVPEAQDFAYLVSNGTDVWTEPYRRDETRDVKTIILDFICWLTGYGLLDTYKQHWEAQ